MEAEHAHLDGKCDVEEWGNASPSVGVQDGALGTEECDEGRKEHEESLEGKE